METHTQRFGTFEYLRCLAATELSRTQRDVMRTLLTYADIRTWELWPSIATIAGAMACDRRTVQRTLRSLHDLGLLTTLGATRSGSCRVRVEVGRLNELATGQSPPMPPAPLAPATPPERQPDAPPCHPPVIVAPPPGDAPPPPPVSPEPQPPRQDDAQSEIRTRNEHHSRTHAAAILAKILGSDQLLSHPNATPERIAFVAAVAPGMKNPAGYAATAIRDAYEPRSLTEAEDIAFRRSMRTQAILRYNAMPEDERARIWELALAGYGEALATKMNTPFVDLAIARTLTVHGL